jgi:SAM-dependent methyltransferase
MPAPHLDQPVTSPGVPFPLKFGSDEDFSRIECLLRHTGYGEENLCRILRVPEICDFAKVNPDTFVANPEEPEALVLLIRIFFLLQDVLEAEVRRLIPASEIESLVALDLIRPAGPPTAAETATDGGQRFCAAVWLYPVGSFFVASDKEKNLPDSVFPAVSPLTFRFLTRLDPAAAAESLDLCCGCGVAALTLSTHSRRVVASDVSARSVHFARFNNRLNRRSNIEVLESDLYAALGKAMFDRIVAHPPYVPSLSNLVAWRDGGETGETLIRSIVEGLGSHLRPGGAFLSACGGFDTMQEDFEHRVRSWLGESHPDFDVLFGLEFEKSPWQLAAELAGGTVNSSNENLRKLLEVFASAGAKRFVIGSLYIERRLAAGVDNLPPFTLRKQLSPEAGGSCFRRFLHTLRRLGRLGGLSGLQPLKPKLAPAFRILITHEVHQQELVPASFVAEMAKPFRVETRLESDMIGILLKCDGKTTLFELFQAARLDGVLPEQVTLEIFLKFGARMMELGYMELDEAASGP